MATKSNPARTTASRTWTNQIRKVLLASVGAVVLAQEEAEEFVEKLVKKGEMAEKDGQKLLHDIMSRRDKAVDTVKSEVSNIEKDVMHRIESMLHKVKLASKKDVDSLAVKIDSLSKVVDRLAKERP